MTRLERRIRFHFLWKFHRKLPNSVSRNARCYWRLTGFFPYQSAVVYLTRYLTGNQYPALHNQTKCLIWITVSLLLSQIKWYRLVSLYGFTKKSDFFAADHLKTIHGSRRTHANKYLDVMYDGRMLRTRALHALHTHTQSAFKNKTRQITR